MCDVLKDSTCGALSSYPRPPPAHPAGIAALPYEQALRHQAQQPPAEAGGAEICVKIGYREDCPVAVLRLVGDRVGKNSLWDAVGQILREFSFDTLLLI